MTANDVLTSLGVTAPMIVRVTGTISDMPYGYEIKKTNISTGTLKQIVAIYPKQPWTDGTIRPIYTGGWASCDYNVSAYLNTRV